MVLGNGLTSYCPISLSGVNANGFYIDRRYCRSVPNLKGVVKWGELINLEGQINQVGF